MTEAEIYGMARGIDKLTTERDEYKRRMQKLMTTVSELTAERDEWKARCEFSFEQRDKLTAERDAARGEAIRLDAGWQRASADMLAANLERAELMQAAKLALDAMEVGHMGANFANYRAAIEALKKAGVTL